MDVDYAKVLNGCTPSFSDEVRARGQSLLQRGAVQVLQRSTILVIARSGSLPYHNVSIGFEPQRIQAQCTCRQIRCEHVWSVLLKLAADHDPELLDRQRRWGSRLQQLEDRMRRRTAFQEPASSAAGPFHYVLEEPKGDPGAVRVRVGTRTAGADGKLAAFKQLRAEQADPARCADEVDRDAMLHLGGASARLWLGTSAGDYELPHAMFAVALEPLARAGRLFARAARAKEAPPPLSWNAAPYRLALDFEAGGDGNLVPRLALVRGDERIDLPADDISRLGGLLIKQNVVSPLADPAATLWMSQLSAEPLGAVKPAELEQVLEGLCRIPGDVRIGLPSEAGVRTVSGNPAPRVVITKPEGWIAGDELDAELVFDYQGINVTADERSRAWKASGRVLVERDVPAETQWRAEAAAAGLRWPPRGQGEVPYVSPKKLPAVVSELIQRGFQVQAEGLVYRQARAFSAAVSSGVDWFQLKGAVDFDGREVPFPRILRALRHRERFVDLGDGTYGMLPEEWLTRLRLLGDLGTVSGDDLRFGRAQLGMLDEILGQAGDTTFDAAFEQAREKLARFEGLVPAEPAPAFAGELRPYQKLGLAWFAFLEEFGFGGCLADDMGLGKTVQVLAHLAGRKRAIRRAPSLVIAPRSLIFNWIHCSRAAP